MRKTIKENWQIWYSIETHYIFHKTSTEMQSTNTINSKLSITTISITEEQKFKSFNTSGKLGTADYNLNLQQVGDCFTTELT